MSAWNIIAVPYAKRSQVVSAVHQHIKRISKFKINHASAETMAARDFFGLRWTANSRAPRQFACYERAMPTSEDPAVFIVTDGRWDLELAAEISRSTGGFSIAAESWSDVSRHGFAIFYAGVPIQAWSQDDKIKHGFESNPSNEKVEKSFEKALSSMMSLEGMLINPMIRPHNRTEIEIIRTCERPGFKPIEFPETQPLHCAFYANIDAPTMDKTLGGTPQINWRVGKTALDVPYGVVIAHRPGIIRWFALQKRFKTQALGISLIGLADSQWWSSTPNHLPVFGTAKTADELLQKTRAFAALLNTNAGDLRVPISA